VSTVYDCGDPEQRASGLRHATDALHRGDLVVLPTDTVYGLAANAFSHEAVARLLAAKGRGRAVPPPVLVHDILTLDALTAEVPDDVRALVAAFWPGGLTVICWAQPTLRWDLGETAGTVALRMPDDEVALEVLAATGPLAVSSANLSGRPAATTAAAAVEQLGDAVSAYLDAGPSRGGAASTIVEATGPTLRIVRTGAVSAEALDEVVPGIAGPGPEGPATPAPATRTPTDQVPDE
jgi:L-threonylcarbamoyladenylate synthase